MTAVAATAKFAFSGTIRLPEYLDQLLDRFPIPEPEQELHLIQKAKLGHEHSLTWLMVGHVRLVSKLASKYAQTFEDGQDLLQEGMLGIRHAVRKFDPTKGCKFTTYANGWIRGYIRRFCYKNRPRQLRLPEKKQIHLDRVKKLQFENQELELEEIAKKAKLKLDYVEDLLFWGLSFQEATEWQEFPYFDDDVFEEEESFEFETEPETKTNLHQIKAPLIVIPEKYQIPVHLLKQWFRVGVAQFVSAAKSQVERTRQGFAQGLSRHFQSTAPEVDQERLNLSTWPTSLSFSYQTSIHTSTFANTPLPSPPTIINLVQGAIAHAQKSLLVLRGGSSDGPPDRPGHQPPPADQRCRQLGEPGATGGRHLGVCPAVTAFIQSPLASVIQSIRGFPPRAGPDPGQQPGRGAVFDSNPPPQPFTHRINAMYKTITAMIAAWLGLLISPAAAETIKIAPGHMHLIDLSASGCSVSKAYMGTRGIFDLSLDQPQPQTQKIYLTWKPNTQVKSTNIILDFVGCNRSSMELVIHRADSRTKTGITRIGAPTPVAQPPEQPAVTGHLGQPPVTALPASPPPAVVPLTLQPQAKTPPKPKTVKRPPVRRITLSQATQPIRVANSDVSDAKVTPSTLLRGLNVARASGDQTYGYRSEMHWRINGMIRQMRWGATAEVAAKRANVSTDQLQTLMSYAQK